MREYALAASLFEDVTVLHVQLVPIRTGHDRLSWRQGVEEGIPTVRVRVPHIRTSYTLAVMGAYQRLWWRGYRPDVIHAYVYHAAMSSALISKLHRVPLVTTEMWTGFPMKELSRLGVLKARIAFGSADYVCPISTSLQQAIADYGIKARFKIVPCTVDTQMFRPKSRLPKGDTKRLISIAILDQPRKGLNFLLNALSALRQHRGDLHLDIVGDGPRRSEYEKMAADLGLEESVTFHGRIATEEIAQMLRDSHVFVLPSLFENFSVATAEALATGTPVVATRCGGPEDFVTPEVGLLVPAGDAAALADAIDRVLANHDRYDPTAVAAYAQGRFSHEAVGMRLHEIYREAAARRQRANSAC